MSGVEQTSAPQLEKGLFRKIILRLVLFVALMYLLNQFDRGSLAFAQTTLSADIGLSDAAFGLGAGIFFIGYFLFEIPSNLLLHRFGARKWLARIMISWGVVTLLMMFAWNAPSFYVLRFALGAAEAGFFPGAVYFISSWLPQTERGKVMAILSAAGPAAYLVAGPMSGVLLGMDGLLGLAGWQWLFCVEGLATLVVGAACLRVLVDTPSRARWLSAEEKQTLHRSLDRDAARTERTSGRIVDVFRKPRVLLLAAVYTCMQITNAGLVFWLPALTSRIDGLATWQVTSLSVIPYAFQIIGLFALGRLSDRHGRRHLYVILGCLCIAIGLAVSATSGATVGLLALCLAFFGYGTMSVFWSLASSFLGPTSEGAAGLAFVNSVAALGGFIGPSIFGLLSDLTGSESTALLGLTFFAIVGCILVAFVKDPRTDAPEQSATREKDIAS